MNAAPIDLAAYFDNIPVFLKTAGAPWDITEVLEATLLRQIETLGSDYKIKDGIAIHATAVIEGHVIMKPPVIISAHSFIAAHAYLRGGVFVGSHCVIGPGTEVKSSVILDRTSLAHFNFAGNSLIGSDVNMEAGAVIANHHNERTDKTIYVIMAGGRHAIPSKKFGAIVGDGTKIGANAVLSPGTILPRNTIVKRLELIEQEKITGNSFPESQP